MSVAEALKSSSKGRLSYRRQLDVVKLKHELSEISPPPSSRPYREKDSSGLNISFGLLDSSSEYQTESPGATTTRLNLSHDQNTDVDEDCVTSPPKSATNYLSVTFKIGSDSESFDEPEIQVKSPSSPPRAQRRVTMCTEPKSPEAGSVSPLSSPLSPDYWSFIQALKEEDEFFRSRIKRSLLERSKQYNDHNKALEYLMGNKRRDARCRQESLKERRQHSIERRQKEEKEEANKTLQSLRQNQEKHKEKMDSQQKEIEKQRLALEREEKKRQEEHEGKVQMLRSLLKQVEDSRSKFIQTHDTFQHKEHLSESVAKFRAVLDRVCAGLPPKIEKASQSSTIPAELLAEFQGHAEKSQIALQFLTKQIGDVENKLKAETDKKKAEELKKTEEKKKAEDLKAEAAQNFGVQALSYALKEKESSAELLAKVEESLKEFVTSPDKQMKQYRFDLQRAVNTPINAISGLATRHLRDKLHRLLALLRGQEVEVSNRRVRADRTKEAMLFCQNLIAKMLVKKGEEQVSSLHESAFPIAAVLLGLWCEFPIVGALFLAHLRTRCPFVLPHYHTRVEGETSAQYHTALGYKVEEDGTVEEQDKYLRRMSGLMRLYCACMVTEPPPPTAGGGNNSTKPPAGQSLYPHPHGLENAWSWLARCLNQDPHPDVTATLVYDVLASSGHWLLRRYSVQFVKLVYSLYKLYVPCLTEVSVTNAAVGRLQIFLENSLGSGRIAQPEGALPQGFWSGH